MLMVENKIGCHSSSCILSAVTMAEGPVAAVQPAAVPIVADGISTSLTEEENFQIGQCERILRFRDEVLSGAHPRIKVPAHLLPSKQSSEARSPASSSSTAVSSRRPIASVENAPKGPRLSNNKGPYPSSGPQVANNLRSFNANAQHSASATNTNPVHRPDPDTASGFSSNMSGIPTGPRAGTGKRFSDNSASAQFDPVLLTKSEDLIKAELQLQRQRLERALSDQLQQHRAATKASHASEALADFDLAEVLMKALQLVQSSAPLQTDANLAANASGAESDSVSNGTFYSSKHDTPESHLERRIPESAEVEAEAEAAQAREDSPYEPPMVMEASPVPGQPPVVAIPPSAANNASTAQYQQPRDPHTLADPDNRTLNTIQPGRDGALGTVQEATGVPMEIISSQESGEASSSRDSGGADRPPPAGHPRLQSVAQQLIEQGLGRRQSPILCAHNLSPFAPQPAHVSPLATSRQPPVPQQFAPPAQATPAQVAALRNDHSNGSSPESSPQSRQNKKGKKNKKRKADGMAAKNAASPFIKPEPRSPSPLTAPQFPRPNKRLRQGQAPGQEQCSHEPRAAEVLESVHSSSYPLRFYRDDRTAVYSSPLGHHVRQDPRPAVPTESPRYEREYREDVRPVETVRYVRRVSPDAHAYPYPPSEVKTIRSVSRATVERPYPYYDSREPLRTVVRPATDRDRSRSPIMIEERPPNVMGPPQLPASRVVVDEFGREYIDPSPRPEPIVIRRSVAPRPMYADREDHYDRGRTTTRVIRRSVAPASIHGEPELIYERAPPPRAASVMPGSGRYDEEVVYRRPASPTGYATTRRVIVRPDYAPEYRYYREREYSTQPSGQPVGGYYEVRSMQEPRLSMGEPSRDYIVRSTTVRPEVAHRPETVRTSSVRPEIVPGEYGAPIHVDDRQAMPPPRAYSVRPMGPPPPQPPQYARQWPEYETRPAYGEQEIRGEDVGAAYIDRAPREVYR